MTEDKKSSREALYKSALEKKKSRQAGRIDVNRVQKITKSTQPRDMSQKMFRRKSG